MDLIENDKLVLVALQIKLRLGEPGKVSFRLEVKVEGRARFRQLERQSGLARLSGTEQGYGGEAVEAVLELREDPPRLIVLANWALKYNYCKDNQTRRLRCRSSSPARREKLRGPGRRGIYRPQPLTASPTPSTIRPTPASPAWVSRSPAKPMPSARATRGLT